MCTEVQAFVCCLSFFPLSLSFLFSRRHFGVLNHFRFVCFVSSMFFSFVDYLMIFLLFFFGFFCRFVLFVGWFCWYCWYNHLRKCCPSPNQHCAQCVCVWSVYCHFTFYCHLIFCFIWCFAPVCQITHTHHVYSPRKKHKHKKNQKNWEKKKNEMKLKKVYDINCN